MYILDALVRQRHKTEDERRLELAWTASQQEYIKSLDWKAQYILDQYIRYSTSINHFVSTGSLRGMLYSLYENAAPQFHDLTSPMPFLEGFGYIPLTPTQFKERYEDRPDTYALLLQAYNVATALLNQVILQAPKIPFDLVAFRGMNTQLQRQSRGNFKGFVSLSKTFSTAYGFMNKDCCMTVVTISKGTPCITFFNEPENEILLPANTYFDVQEFNEPLYQAIEEYNKPVYSEMRRRYAKDQEFVDRKNINFVTTASLDEEEAQRRDAASQRRRALYESGLAKERERLSGGSMERLDPALWERIKKRVISEDVQGTRKGEWSARKAQLAVKRYKEAGGRYRGPKSPSNSLVRWGKQKWRTKSGKPSSVTGERYLPSKAIRSLSPKEYARTSKAKRRSMSRGKQYSRQPRDIAKKTRRYSK